MFYLLRGLKFVFRLEIKAGLYIRIFVQILEGP